MKDEFKKISSAFFLLLGLVPMLFLLFVMLQKREIREKMNRKLETDKLQTIVLPEEKVIWMDKHEIWVNEHMFDIHSKKLAKGIYTFTGLYDTEETEIVKKERKATGDNSEQNKLLAHFFKHLPVFHESVIAGFSIATSQNPFNHFALQHSINQYIEIITPPPQVC